MQAKWQCLWQDIGANWQRIENPNYHRLNDALLYEQKYETQIYVTGA